MRCRAFRWVAKATVDDSGTEVWRRFLDKELAWGVDADSVDLSIPLLVHALGFVYGLTVHCGSTPAGGTLPHISVGLLSHEGVDDDGFQVENCTPKD